MVTGHLTSFNESYFVQVTITMHLKLFSEPKLRRQYHRKTSHIQIVLTLNQNVQFLDRFQFYVQKHNTCTYKKNIFFKRFNVLILELNQEIFRPIVDLVLRTSPFFVLFKWIFYQQYLDCLLSTALIATSLFNRLY